MTQRTDLRIAASLGALLAAGAAHAGQMDLETFNNLRTGMYDSEVLLRAGEPDRITAPGGYLVSDGPGAGAVAYTGPRVEFHYLPDGADHDPWLTVVTITNGRVSALRREKITGPIASPGVPAEEAARAPRARGDHAIRSERAERTLRAAERYAEVRWRIRERTAALEGEPSSAPRAVYRGTDDQGTPYFGDVAPRNGEAAAD